MRYGRAKRCLEERWKERIVGIVKIVAREEIGISNSARMDGWMGLARSHSFEVTSVDVASSANDCNLVIW